MSNASVIDRVRKLRALATSDNLNEAANAARLAEKLLQEHALSEADFFEAPEEELPVFEDCIAWTSKAIAWQNVLGQGIAKQYQCSPISTWDGRTGKKVLRVFGRPTDIETFKFQYAFYAAEIARLCNRICKGLGRSFRASFCQGAVNTILAALREVQQEARVHATGSALVRVDQRTELADAALVAAFPKCRTTRTRIRLTGAFEAGQRAGAGIRKGGVLGAGGVRMLGS